MGSVAVKRKLTAILSAEGALTGFGGRNDLVAVDEEET
jgi:hypothetical protein